MYSDGQVFLFSSCNKPISRVLIGGGGVPVFIQPERAESVLRCFHNGFVRVYC